MFALAEKGVGPWQSSQLARSAFTFTDMSFVGWLRRCPTGTQPKIGPLQFVRQGSLPTPFFTINE
jgi:hypothetical protein